MQIKGFAAPETKAAAEQAQLLIEQAEELGEPPEDPLLLVSVLYSFGAANVLAFDSDVCCDFAARFLAVAEKQGATVPLMFGHDLMGVSSLYAGDFVKGRAHLDQAISLYDPSSHRALATRFGHDIWVVLLSLSWGSWVLGYPEAALADATHALKDAREIGHAASLMFALCITGPTRIFCGEYAAAIAQSEEVLPLADEKGAVLWKAWGLLNKGCVSGLTGEAADAVQTISAGMAAWRSTGSTLWMPFYLSHLAKAYEELGQLDAAWRCVHEAAMAVETRKERWCEAELNRIAGEIALKSPEQGAAKAEAYFTRALTIARQQHAKSWELRSATSMARLWRSQGKRDEARDLLAPVYGWFTEGFDTLDLKEAKALLEELAS
jgi:predicted ATPase